MTLPNFLMIGAPKSGTTAFYQMLKQHPQIFMTKKKEPHFFSQHLASEYNIDRSSRYLVKLSVQTLEHYQQLFKGSENYIAVGEASTSYLYSQTACQTIKKMIPQVKLIAILRHPVDRAYSNFMHQRRGLAEPIDHFIDALAAEDIRIRECWLPIWYYKKLSLYFEPLRCYYNTFNSDQIKVIIYDDFITNPESVLQNVFQFLQVDEAFVPDSSIKSNSSGIPKNPLIYRILRKGITLLAATGLVQGQDLRERWLHSNLVKQPLDPEIRQSLIPLFKDDILKLQTLINRDLSIWL